MITQRDFYRRPLRRPGAAMIMMIVCIIGLFGLLALAIEIGMVAVARSQAQNAADGSAMAGARSINGDSSDNYNLSGAPGTAVKAAVANSVLGQFVTGNPATVASTGTDAYSSGQVALLLGTYGYNYDDADTSQEGFKVVMPRAASSTEPYSAVRSTISGSANLSFARVFGMTASSVQATAVAVHRPRDVFIIMDLSGSMRYQSLPGIPTGGTRTSSMNPDPDYPQFGHYSDTSGAALYGNTSTPTGGGEYYDPGNQTYASNSGPAIAEDFYANAVGVAPSSSNRAFTRGPATYATTPGGDNYLKTNLNTGAVYAHNMTGVNNASTTTNTGFEINGYQSITGNTFNGYTEGPGYWGKTFFIWPPCPGFANPPAAVATFPMPTSLTDTSYKWHTWGDTNPRDWRQRFFVAVNTSSSNSPGLIQHNTILFSSTGLLKVPLTSTSVTENGTSYNYSFRINYAAILYWLKQTPVHFPSTMQAGRIRYYSAMPDGTDTTLNNRWWTTKPSALPNDERFWKDYIDFVLGCTVNNETTTSYSYNDISGEIGAGDFYTWSGSTIAVNAHNSPNRVPANPHRSPTTPYLSGTTGSHETGTTGPYQTGTTSALASKSATTVSMNSLSTTPTKNTDYATFTGATGSYKITNNSKTSLTLSTGLSAAVSKSAAVQIYPSNNATSSSLVSVADTSLNGSSGAGNFVAFKNDTSTLYSINSTSTLSAGSTLTLSTGLASAVNLSGDAVQFFASDGSKGSTTLSVTGLSAKPNSGSSGKVDYVIVNDDTANPYLLTGCSNGKDSNTYILTLSPGLAKNVNVSGATVKIYSPYMDYSDEVRRPRGQFWFGPQTWIDWLGNYNTGKFGWPGNVHEAQAWACKVGISAAIDDIRNNHPNDYIGMTFFSSPSYSTSDTSGHHNRAVVPLGRNYQQLKDSLWFPPSTVTGTATEISPYDADFNQVPRANGSTAPQMGFMIAYNQLSNSLNSLRLYATPSTTYRGNAGGLGRKGASRIVIFETDGAPNYSATATIKSQGADSYYPIRVKDPTSITSSSNVEFPGGNSSISVSSATSSIPSGVVQQICALDTASPPGFATTRHPAYVYPIGYGSLFDAANTSSDQTAGLTFLQTVAYYGKTATDKTGANFPDLFRVYGTNDQRIARMQKAFTSIMQSGTQVSLIE